MRSKIKFLTMLLAVVFLLTSCIQISDTRNMRHYGNELLELPASAFDGEWAELAVAEGHTELLSSIEGLNSRAGYVVKVRILDERKEIREFGDTVITANMFTINRFEILGVYKGDAEIGEIRELGRTYQVERSYRARRVRPEVEFSIWNIYPPISVGDELILFLRSSSRYNWHHSLVNPIQGAYYYTPQELRQEYDNWVFESVIPYNNLVLTEIHLQKIAEGNRLRSVIG